MCRSSISKASLTPKRSQQHAAAISEIDRELARRLYVARTQSSLTIAELADAIGVANATYQAIERGEERISSLDLARLAMTHALPIAWFFETLPGQSIFTRQRADKHKE